MQYGINMQRDGSGAWLRTERNGQLEIKLFDTMEEAMEENDAQGWPGYTIPFPIESPSQTKE